MRPFAEIETEPYEKVEDEARATIVANLDALRARSPFYRKKFADAAAVRTWEDFQRLPFTEKGELRERQRLHPPFGDYHGVDVGSIRQVQASSGTSGRPTYVPGTSSDVEVWAEMCARTKWCVGVRPGDVAIQLTSMAKGFVGGVPTTQGLQRAGACVVPMGAEAGIDRLMTVVEDLRPAVIVATPSFAKYFAEVAKEHRTGGVTDVGVRLVAVGGEPGGGIGPVRAALEDLWSARVREMLGGSDFGSAYWGECEAGEGMHFCGQGLVHVELLDSAGEAIPFEAGRRGELVYSAVERQAAPLLRFRVGDIVDVLSSSPCSCGRTSPRVRCVGRSDDMLIVRGVNVYPSGIQEIIGEFSPVTTGQFQIVRDFEGHATDRSLNLVVEVDPEQRDLVPRIEERIHAKLSVKVHIDARTPGEIQDDIGPSKLQYFAPELG